MEVFADTEFSSLGSDPRLISIALVATSGEAIYIEFTSGWDVEHCSKWVVEHVLPHLGRGEKLDRRASAHRIDEWLSGFTPAPAMIVDSRWDADLIAALFAENGIGAGRHRIQAIQFQSKAHATEFEAMRQRYFLESGLHQHHALNDAHALRFAWGLLQKE